MDQTNDHAQRRATIAPPRNAQQLAFTPPPDRIPQITENLNRVSKGLCVLQENIDALENRLGLVLSPAVTLAGMPPEEGGLVPLAEELHRADARIGMLCQMVRTITERIEL